MKNARILPKELDQRSEILSQLCVQSFNYVNLEQDGQNILWILCHHGSVIKTSPYLLEKALEIFPEETLKNHLDLLLITGVKIFLQSPAESQHILGKIFQLGHQQVGTSADVSQKLTFYGKLLQNHHNDCREILLIE